MPPSPPINLSRGWPSPSLLPTALIASAAATCLSDPSTATAALSYGPDPGHEPARIEIAKWLTQSYTSSSLKQKHTPTLPSNLCITGGASQNLGNLLSVYTDPAFTRSVWIVAPAYFLSFGVFADAGFGSRMRAVGEDGEGLDLGELERGILEREGDWEREGRGVGGEGDNNSGIPGYNAEKAREKVYKHVVYCVPTFANPSGATMSLRRREGLVRLARRFDALVIADDVYDFLHWPAEPSEVGSSPSTHGLLPRLVDIDREIDGGTQRDGADGFGNACSNGSFSKIAGPGVRCGWLEGSEKFAYGVSQIGTTISGGAPSQLTSTFMTHLLKTNQLQSHIKQTLQPAYANRYHTLLTAIKTYLVPLGFSLPTPKRADGVAGGFFLWLALPYVEGFVSAGEFARLCAREGGVVVSPGEVFEVPGDCSVGFGGCLRVCFAWVSEGELVEGVRRIERVAGRVLREGSGGKVEGEGEGESESEKGYVFVGRGDLSEFK